jgi:hypothetical protein
MKKLILLSLLLLFSISLMAQDIIVTKDGERIEAKIVEEYEAVIKYALFSELDGALHLLLKTNIKTITYQNGRVENFDAVSNDAEKITQVGSSTNPKGQKALEKIRENVIRINPLVTLIGAFVDMFEIEVQYARYLTSNLAIPFDFDYGRVKVDTYGRERVINGFSLMTGVEAVPITHRQKSGLFVNILAGVMLFDDEVGFLTNVNLGYQLMSKEGFVMNAAIGLEYNGITNRLRPRFMLALGFAF